jgi:hypothetical protein
MKRLRKPRTVALLLLALCLVGLASANADRVARAQSGGGFDLSWHVVSNGGGPVASSSSFQLNGTVGQPGVGTGLVTGGSRQIGPGFWYGVGGGSTIYLPLVMRNYP